MNVLATLSKHRNPVMAIQNSPVRPDLQTTFLTRHE